MRETGETTIEISEIKLNLINLGMEEAVANDLLPEELNLYKGATSLVMYSEERTFMSDKSLLKITTYAVSLPEKRSRVLHYMEWIYPPIFRGVDVLSIEFNQNALFCADTSLSVTGIYENDGGKIYYKSDKRAQIQVHNIFNISNVNLYEAPLGKGEKLRTYISYELFVNYPGYSSKIILNYYHKPYYLTFPYTSSEAFVQRNGQKHMFNHSPNFTFSYDSVTVL